MDTGAIEEIFVGLKRGLGVSGKLLEKAMAQYEQLKAEEEADNERVVTVSAPPSVKYLIKIQRSSIRKNPDAGKTHYVIPGRATERLTRLVKRRKPEPGPIVPRPPDVAPGKTGWDLVKELVVDGLVIESQVISPDLDSASNARYFSHPYIMELWRGEIAEIVLERQTTRDVQTIRSMFPASEHLCAYEPTTVTCRFCGQSFLHTELQYYEFGGEDDEAGADIDNICPKCKAPDCCEIEYEKLTDKLIKEE